MASIDYQDVLNRIQSGYSSCSRIEQQMLKNILQEIIDTGDSYTLEKLWLSDFKEVPVSIDQFLCDPQYLGESNRQGEAVYPFWKSTMHNIFSEGNKYSELIFSGATRIGKSSTAVSIMAYMLYRLMIYRNPHEYFKKKSVSRFTLAFANLTKDLASGVAFHEFQTTLKTSPWFNEHGRFTNSVSNYVYVPEGEMIDIIPASDSAHVLGMQLWCCLVGSTKILTAEGDKTIESCAETYQDVLQWSQGKFITTQALIKKTKEVYTTVRVKLCNGSVFEGTPEHKMLLDNGTYKELSELSVDDTLFRVTSALFSYNTTKVVEVSTIYHDSPVAVYDVINVEPDHNFAILANNTILISHNCLMDEINFSRAGIKDINISKQHMKNLYNTAHARITGTFKLGGEVYGKLISSSSKNTDTDYLSEHIQTQLDAGNTHMYLVDEPQWKVLPKEMFSDQKFHITVGDRYKRGFVVPKENEDELHLREYENQGYQLLEVPLDFRTSFLADYDIALRDIAGISVVGAMGFITQESITPNISETRKNPFLIDVIVSGIHDNESIERNFHINLVEPRLKTLGMRIHIDFAEVSDRIGICGVVQDGTKIVLDLETGKKISLPFYRQIFQVGIEAPQGERMSFQKVINFILWLRQNGFYISGVSTDQFQSSYVRETLNQQGFITETISVDKSEDPYISLRNLLQDQRIELIKHQIQEDELVHLQRINGRIDHPPQSQSSTVRSVGKDCSDALCGACYAHIKHQDAPKPPARSVANVISGVNSKFGNRSAMPSVFKSPYRRF
jgi:hypothetical protein